MDSSITHSGGRIVNGSSFTIEPISDKNFNLLGVGSQV